MSKVSKTHGIVHKALILISQLKRDSENGEWCTVPAIQNIQQTGELHLEQLEWSIYVLEPWGWMIKPYIALESCCFEHML